MLDAFSGTSIVGYRAKLDGKLVYSNDILKFNYYVALALIENNSTKLSTKEVSMLLTRHKDIDYPTFIQDTFKDLYYTDEENRWLDMVVTNINELIKDKYKRAIAFVALGQACLVKRPYNLFHRANLYMRFANVKRSFGNKRTWDTPFEVHFRKFINEYNNAVFDNGLPNRAFNSDILKLEFPNLKEIDLIYMDPPYLPLKGDKPDYHLFYHFLEGLVDYKNWPKMIDVTKKLKPIKYKPSPWIDKRKIYTAFEKLFQKFRNNKYLVVSYNTKGIPTIEELEDLLKIHKDFVVIKRRKHQYALSKNRAEEVLLIALDENPKVYGLI